MNKKSRICALLLLLAVSLAGCGQKREEPEESNVELNISQMQSICDLATLECYYHNTAKFDSQKKVLFWNTSKKLWIEYSGIVRVGVDVSKLTMEVKDEVVTITMPEAKVISCKVDEQSLTEDSFYSETKGLGSGKINAEDQSQAFQAAQDGMLAAAEEDELLLRQAKLRAQTLIENYVKNIGEALGVEYEVRWKTTEAEEGP